MEYVSVSLLFNCQVSCWHVELSVSNWYLLEAFCITLHRLVTNDQRTTTGTIKTPIHKRTVNGHLFCLTRGRPQLTD